MGGSAPLTREVGAVAGRLDVLLLALFGVSLVALALHSIVAHDVWWQLATGARIAAHGFPDTDPYSYGFPDRRWVELRWLYCVVADAIASRLGMNGLILAKCGAVVAAFGALAALVWTRQRWVPLVGLLSALCLMYGRFNVRPELVTYVCIPVFLLCLDRFKRHGTARWLLPLPLLQILWSNAHTLSILGPVLVGTLTAAELLQRAFGQATPLLRADPRPLGARSLRRLVLVAGLVCAALFATPYGLEGVLFPFILLGQINVGSELGLLIDEFRSPFLNPHAQLSTVAYPLLMLGSAGSFVLPRVPLLPYRVALWGGFLFLSLLSMRNVALFGLVGGAVTALNLRDFAEARGRSAGTRSHVLDARLPWLVRAPALALLLVLPWAAVTDRFWRQWNYDQRFGFGVATSAFPIGAMAFVRREGLPRPVIGSLGDGGYLLFEGGPKSVFIDGRLEVYGAAIATRAIRALQDGPSFERLVDAYGIDTAVLQDPLLREAIEALDAREDWQPVYFDERYLVYVRETSATRGPLTRLALDWETLAAGPPARAPLPAFESPPSWPAGRFAPQRDARPLLREGDLLLARGALVAARARFAAAQAIEPDNEHALISLGAIASELGDAAAAAGWFSQASPGGLGRPEVLLMRSGLARKRGRADAAIGFLEQLVDGEAAAAVHHRMLAAALRDAGRGAESARVLGAALEQHPADAGLRSDLGDLAAAEGNFDQAIGHYRESLRLDPARPESLFNLGSSYASAGDYARAREAWQGVLRLVPAHAGARAHLARLEGARSARDAPPTPR